MSEVVIPDDAPFGLVLRALREQRGWSSERYAALASFSGSYIRRIESGARTPSDLRVFVDLVRPFQLAPDDLRRVCQQWMWSLGIAPLC